ncbi:MAG: MFS transporter [Solirubrobacterales bacterium]|nr:MFS transporter [Solirubrobacterales bacterium]
MSSQRTRRSGAATVQGTDRSTVVLIRVLLGFESVLYSVVAPLLPHYAHQFGASKPAIGVLAAAYPAGMLPGSLLGGWVATRTGVRRTTVVGLVLFTASIAAFGFGSSIAVLDGLRFVQGIACGYIWSGGLAWVIAIAPRGQRGEVLGSVLASAIFGTLLGPVLGTLAVAAGTGIVFVGVGVVSLALTAWTVRHPEPPRAALGGGTSPRALAASPAFVVGFWLILLVACTIGATETLLPLRLARFGTSGIAIGVTFILASLLSTLLAPGIGRMTDRRGNALPLIAGLGLTAVLLALLPLPQTGLPLAVLTVMTLGGPLTASTTAAMSLMTDAIERVGAALAFGTMLLNLAWGMGETFGAPAAATLSRATSDAVPLLLLAAAMLLTLAPVVRVRLGGDAPRAATASAGGASSDDSTISL